MKHFPAVLLTLRVRQDRTAVLLTLRVRQDANAVLLTLRVRQDRTAALLAHRMRQDANAALPALRVRQDANAHPITRSVWSTLTVAILLLPVLALAAWADPPAPAWQPPGAAEIKSRALAWLETRKPDAALRAKGEAIWADIAADAQEDELLARLARTFALADPRAERLVELCAAPRRELVPPDQSWLRDPDLPSLVSANLRLLYAEWLVRESLYDEAAEQLSGLVPGDVAAPASLLFYQSVVHHALLNKESGLQSLDVLLEGSQSSPRRYVALARLMHEDLKSLQDDTLDHIVRRMDDIRRRLDLGRAGPKVRAVEDGVVESLDKLIKKLEEQQKKQQAGSGGGPPGTPMPDSRIAGGKGPGEVAKKKIGSESGWGDLPPKERDEALQQIGRDFPSHYRDVVEQYFRRLAAEDNK